MANKQGDEELGVERDKGREGRTERGEGAMEQEVELRDMGK